MALLSPSQIADIRNAIKLATDQFFITPVTYSMQGEASLDRFNEDRPDANLPPVELKALVEYPSNTADFGREVESGIALGASVKLSLNMDDLTALDLTNADGTHKFEAGDFFTTQSTNYRVLYAGYDGPLEQKNVLAIIYGEERE